MKKKCNLLSKLNFGKAGPYVLSDNVGWRNFFYQAWLESHSKGKNLAEISFQRGVIMSSDVAPTKEHRTVIGISFGNSNSSIAYTTSEGKAEVIANEDGGI